MIELENNQSRKVLEYCEQYFFMYNYRHFKMWCDCHEGEDSTKTDSWFNYVDKVLVTEEELFRILDEN